MGHFRDETLNEAFDVCTVILGDILWDNDTTDARLVFILAQSVEKI